ncbi:hypothetical protein FXO37_34249 [Capsicum annuum]|nr:hypothetical protein FXO37_34249 [Capsicum annuum]
MVSNSGKGELGSSSLSRGFDEKENESKAAKLKSPAKGSKNFMSLMISTSSKIAQSPKKKILVERNDLVRTSITLSDSKATFFSANSEEHNQNSDKFIEPKETVPIDGFPPDTKTPKGESSLTKDLLEESDSSSSEEAFTEAMVDQEEEPAMPVAKQIDEPALPVAEDISEAKMKSKARFSTILSTGSEELDKKFEPIELEEDEESETETDEEEFQMDVDLDDGGKVEIEGVDVLEIEEASAIQLAELREMNLIVQKGIWTKGFTTSNVEVELAESQSFIADNALESMIDNPESIVKEISAIEEAQPLEMMESPIRHDEDNRKRDKTLHLVAVSSKKFATHHVVKEKHSSQNWPTEVDVAGARRPSEMSIFQISSSHSKKYPKSEDDKAQSIQKKPRKSNRRESLAASEFSMGSPSYGSFTTYERIPAKHASGEEEVIIPVRRSSRIRSHVNFSMKILKSLHCCIDN